jgi:hypothetical protein
MSSIIAICGFMGSGKDTIADYLQTFHGYKRESFANSLKDAVSVVFGWDREMLEGRTKQSREWRETRDEWWSKRLGRDITPRYVLQYWGTEVVRKGFHDDMWVASLEHRLLNSRDDIVITDCRFPNEITALKNIGATVIRVKRGPEPAWYNAARDYNKGMRELGWALGKDVLEKANVHASEYSWVGSEFDFVIENDGTVDDLFNGIKQVLSKSQEQDHLVAIPDLL